MISSSHVIFSFILSRYCFRHSFFRNLPKLKSFRKELSVPTPRNKYSYNEKRKAWIAFAWDGTYDANGKKRRKQIISKKSSRDLEYKVHEFKRQIKENGPMIVSKMTFGEYANYWLTSCKEGTREKNTVFMYQNIIKHHMQHILNIPISQIQHHHFQELINNASKKSRTCQQIYITFRQIIRLAVQDRIISQNDYHIICDNISLPKRKSSEKRPLTALEKEAIKKCNFSLREKCFVSILCSCGLRREEILALTPEDFDFSNKMISINKVVIFVGNSPEIKNSPKTERGYRKVPFPHMDEFKDYILSSRNYVFGTDSGKLISQSAYVSMFNRIRLKINEAAGGKNAYNEDKKKSEIVVNKVPGLTAHIFRHNYCTELCYLIPQISIKKIAYLMGDTEKVVMDVYTHIIEEKEDVTDVVNQIRIL